MHCWYGFITLIRTTHHKFNYYSPIYKDLYDSSLIKKKTIRNTFPFFSWKLLTKSLNYFHIQTIIWHFLSNVKKKWKATTKGVINTFRSAVIFRNRYLWIPLLLPTFVLMSSAEIMFITTEINFWWSILRALQKFTRFSILSPLKWMIGIWLHIQCTFISTINVKEYLHLINVSSIPKVQHDIHVNRISRAG